LARVSRVTKGGKRFSFRATVAIGDQKSRVGVGIGKGQDVQKSIQKAYAQARKSMLTVTTVAGTIPYQVEAKYSSARVLLKPSKGGIKAGGAVRVIAQLAGITSLTGKNLGRTNNKLNIARAALVALAKLRPVGAPPKAPKDGAGAQETK
jgi:small subunit ribosomal protein S5